MSRRKKWVLVVAVFGAVLLTGLYVAALMVSKRFEPYIREQAIQYVRTRFNSEVELPVLRVRLPQVPPVRLLLSRGRGGLVRVEGESLVVRHGGRRDVPPMFTIRKFSFEIDAGALLETPKIVRSISIDGMEINVPPKERRTAANNETAASAQAISFEHPSVLIERVQIKSAELVVFPADRKKLPLRFDIHDLRLDSAGAASAMKYDARITNPRPPGMVHSTGSFGPWVGTDPGDTPLSGEYTFRNADLGVFSSIGGTLSSTGRFEGTLDSLVARGEASVPNFRLRKVGNPIPLAVRFEAIVDGTNGNTILKPVVARLGSTNFTTSGAVIKHEGDRSRAIQLDVSMPKGDLRDLLRLAMKGSPFMEGQIFLKTKIDIPPLTGDVRDKLMLDGQFEISEGKFLKSTIQDQIDTLSRRGQGQPTNRQIDEVVSDMKGTFNLKNELITFNKLSFRVPGAKVELAGDYHLETDVLDFRGKLALQAKLSQTLTGWKRWALKPVDPFFSKEGAGTLLHIKIGGAAAKPQFGLDRGKKD